MSWRSIVLMGLLCFPGAALAGPLFDAAQRGDVIAGNSLLDGGTPADERGQNKETPLIAAALAGNVDVAVALIGSGANVMARNRSGFTPLHAAAYGGHPSIVLLLLDDGAELSDNKNRAGKTPLFLAAEEDRIEVAEMLLARGADATAIDGSGHSLLVRTVLRRRDKMAGLLKKYGATCPAPEEFGGPEFHRSCIEAGQ